MTDNDPANQLRRDIDDAIAAGEPTAWFETLYAAAANGTATVPWDRGAPAPLLVQWAQNRQPAIDGTGKRALVVGCGLGDDAAFIATLGFDTIAFDISESAIRAARNRFPGSGVQFVTADLLDPPAEWRDAFDFVLESRTVQALPDPPRRQAIENIGPFVAPGGTLLVMAFARDDDALAAGPPWPLSRAEIDAFATNTKGLQNVQVTRETHGTSGPETSSWCAEFHRS
jgi:SAM-dependent methyltransferase